MTTFVKAFGRLGGILALILLIIALLRQLIALVGFLLAVIKIAIVVIFVGLLCMVLLAMFRERSRRRREAEDL
jgi:O-antigen ligase